MDPTVSTDPEPASNVDPRTHMDTDYASNIDSGILTLDHEHVSYVPAGAPLDSIRSDLVRCVNCGSDLIQRRTHHLNLNEVASIIQQWIAPHVVTGDSIVCHSCWTLALNESTAQPSTSCTSGGRGRIACVNCGCSLLRMRCHRLHTETERETRIRNIIMQWINPRQLRTSDQICHPCWQRSDRASMQQPPNESATINLPHIRRAADTQTHCFFPECNSEERLRVPYWLRVKLFTEFKYYVPINCRICSFHLRNDNWQLLENIQQPLHSFSANHIEDFAYFINERNLSLDLTNIEQISEDTLYYWIGLTKDQFNLLVLELPRVEAMHNGRLALATYLLKLRTGISDERISSLLNIPRSTLMRLMSKARDLLTQDFVPRNLGINNLSRPEIAARNLLIPNTLFSRANQPIVIMDGTYLYIQKSSNYMYQKDTYSLHKYRNLMKPFLLVCCDGYIIDVLGPYPATTSDADILFNEFNNEANTLQQYFQPGDVFILDRGFRDCVPFLRQCNFSIEMPASLQEGETQLSTLAANKSRTVTMCRWVVEAVNGIFKRSYKLLRHEFFNRASKHAMSDFRIAAALINRFHQRFTNRDDAVLILEIIEINMHVNNDLGDYVIQNNLNRRRTQFFNILVNINNLNFPRLEYNDLVLIACGTYQIKQARSYFGEHTRGDGSYSIEVCRETASNLLPDFPMAQNSMLLRGKIQSRHISRKIYFAYILYNTHTHGRQAITQYYCNCMVGRRTVGCCAHVMTLIWYLSWARYQDNINPPAQFLDSILLTYDSE